MTKGNAPAKATSSAVALAGQVEGWTPDQIDLIRRTLMHPASTDDEMALFLMQATRTGLDPFAKQIYAIHRWDSRSRQEKMTIQVGIDGFRLVAQRSGEMDGRDGPYWCGQDGQWCDVWLASEHPAAAKITIFRKGHTHGYTAVARWDEYVQTFKRDGQMQVSPMWKRMGSVMLAKCAEALALRQAFPAELSGLYTSDEMSQADSSGLDVKSDMKKVADQLAEDQRKAAPSKAKSKAKSKAPPAVAADGGFVAPDDTKKTATGAAKAKFPCHHCKKEIPGNCDIAYGKFSNGAWYIAHWSCHSEAVEPKFQGDPVVDGEYEDVDKEAQKRVREAVKGKPAEKLLNTLAGPVEDEIPIEGGDPAELGPTGEDVDDLDAEVPN